MSVLMSRRGLLSALPLGLLAAKADMLSGAAPAGFFGRIGKPIGLQLYTLGDDIGRDLERVLAEVAAIGYRDIEVPRLLGRTPAEIRAAADAAGLRISCLHLPIGPLAMPGSFLLTNSDQQIADALGALGASQAVVPMFKLPDDLTLLPGESFQAMLARKLAAAGEDIWKRTADLLNERAAALKRLGITLGYHNHNIEFAAVGKRTGWDIIAAETDPSLVFFEVDLGWVAAAGLDPAAFLKRQSGRVRWVHVKDVKATTKPNHALHLDPAEVGAGWLDWRRILRAAEQAGVQHYYVEQEPPFAIPRMEAIRRSYAFLSALRA